MQHDCCKSESKQQKPKKKFDTFLLSIIVGTLLLLGGTVYLGTKMGGTSQVAADTQVSAVVNETQHDWGTIGINNGIVTKSFNIENNGSAPLKIYDVKTSCMCTTAQLITSEKSSKKFGMHEKYASVFEINPGESAELLIEFDPLFHGPSGVGPISRIVSMETNDPSNPSLSFHLTANVVSE